MRIKKHSSKKKFIIPLVAIVAAVGGYFAYAALNQLPPFTRSEPDSNIDYNPPTDEQKDNGSDISGEGKTSTEPSKPTTPGSSTPTTPSSNTVGVEIPTANQNDGKLQIRTLIQTVNSGTCTLTMSRAGSQTITRTAKNQPLSSTSTCMGFDISTAGLAKGAWQITIDFVGGTTKGSASRSVLIK